jgi:hypothetical protein
MTDRTREIIGNIYLVPITIFSIALFVFKMIWITPFVLIVSKIDKAPGFTIIKAQWHENYKKLVKPHFERKI